MHWNRHFAQEGTHAFLSPSQASWVNYDEDALIERFVNQQAITRGTELHSYAETAIKHKIRQPENTDTLYHYINDGIDYNMDPEVVLFASKWCYGTADTISFRIEPDESSIVRTLRIHDLKTGKSPAKIRQLEVYAALFCLEYGFIPSDINIVLRIYQFNEIVECRPESKDIVPIMDKISRFTDLLESIEKGE